MRINRQKRVNRTMRFFINNYGFRKPYQILVDGTFCNAALKDQIDIKEQLTKYLDGDVKLLTTPCSIIEGEKLGPALYGAVLILKKFPVLRCEHKTPIYANKCFRQMISNNNPHRYILATQDRELQEFSKKIPGTPLLFIYNKAPTLEVPNDISVTLAQNKTHQSCGLSETEKGVIVEMKKSMLGEEYFARNISGKRKRKKKGGPNPLSCKKKKKKN